VERSKWLTNSILVPGRHCESRTWPSTGQATQNPAMDLLPAAGQVVRAISGAAVAPAETTMFVAVLALVRADPLAVPVIMEEVVPGDRAAVLVVPVMDREGRMETRVHRHAVNGVGLDLGDRVREDRTGVVLVPMARDSMMGRAIRKWTP
jgi:hypothetical protein